MKGFAMTQLPMLLLLLLLAASSWAKDVPSNLQTFYDTVRNADGPCGADALLAEGFHAHDDGDEGWGYCQHTSGHGQAIYLKGPGHQLADMDIDCDGDQSRPDPRCQGSGDTQGATAWQQQLQRQANITDLNASVHPYVVLGNEGSVDFDPRVYGIYPLSVVAVVCGGQLFYGIWGDINGDDHGQPLVGEASLALATLCFGPGMNANSGHEAADVLYIAFSGPHAVPRHARWRARTTEAFEASISGLGDALVAGL